MGLVRSVWPAVDRGGHRSALSLLLDAIRRVGGDDAEVAGYELVVQYAGERDVVTTVVVPPQTVGGRQRRPGSAA